MTGARYAGPFGWRSAARSKSRLMLSGAAIALGVALGYAIHLINTTAVDEFTRGLRLLSGSADLTVSGPRSGMPIEVYATLARAEEVAVASPIIEVEGRIPGERDVITLLGVDALRAGAIAPALIAEAAQPLDLFREDAIFPSAMLAARARREVGDWLDVQIGGAVHRLRIGGLLSAQAPDGMVAVMDIAALQTMGGALDRISRVDLRLRPGVQVDRAIERLRTLLPASAALRTPDAAHQASARMSRAYRINLTVLSLVALFTGSLLVFSCEALSIARRRTEIALLRVLGMTRAQVLWRLMRQASVLGLASALVGLALGLIAAYLILWRLGPDLGAGYFRGSDPQVRPTLTVALVFFACGVVAALAGALLPAIEAARAAPAQALKPAAGVLPRWAPLRGWSALGLVVAGMLLTRVPPVTDLPVAGYAAIGCFLLAAIVALPALCSWLLACIPAVWPVAPWLAIARVRRSPNEAAISLAAMVAAVSLTVSMAVMVGSFRGSLIDWLDQLLPADLYLRTIAAGEPGLLNATDQARIAATPGVRRVEFLRADAVHLHPERAPVALLARDIEAARIHERLPMIRSVVIPGDAIPVWLSEVASGLLALDAGESIVLPVRTVAGGTPPRVFVAGVWRDYGRAQGAIVIERSRYAQITGDTGANDAAIWYQTAGAASQVASGLGWLSERVELATPGEIKRVSVRVFDRTFAVTYGLEVMAILIGVAGLSAGIGASVAARRREFGVLRHLGMTRAQIARMLAGEGIAMTAVGVVVGALTGWVLSFVLIEVVNRQSFHWGMDMHIPFGAILWFCGALIAVSAFVAMASGRQAMDGDAVRAVRDDW